VKQTRQFKTATTVALLALGMLTLHNVASAQIVVPACGNEGERPCTNADPEYHNNNDYGFPMSCDFGLVVRFGIPGSGVPTVCVNGSATYDSPIVGSLTVPPRHSQAPDTSWVAWAMAKQRYGVGGDAPMNYVTTVGTHNSFSSYGQGFLSVTATDQLYSITDQLNLGARYIRLDGYFWLNEMRLCHGSSTECAATLVAGQPISSGRLFANAVKEVANWLNAHPKEFLVLDLNGDPSTADFLVMEPIKQLIGTSKIVTLADAQCTGLFNCKFPSINWALNNGKQVVILARNYANYDPQLYGPFLFPRAIVLDEKDPFDPTGSTPPFPTCLDNNFQVIPHHQANQWVYASEDRSSSVSALQRSDFIGYVDELQVQQAVNCGYNLIVFDFLNSRSLTADDPFKATDGWPRPVLTDEDHRFEKSVWSFEPGDYGSKSYAFMQVDGRWSTTDPTANLRYACSSSSSFDPLAGWFLSSASGPYFDSRGRPAGMAACAAQGGYFSHPVNGSQNSQLFTAAGGHTSNGQSTGGENVWLNHVLNANYMTFDTSPSGLGIVLDGTTYTAPLTIPLPQGSTHALSVQNQATGAAGTRYDFQIWSDQTVTSTRLFVVPSATGGNLTAKYAASYLVSLAANPPAGGSVAVVKPTNDGYYPEGAQITISATPAAGYAFGSFSGTQPGAINPVSIRIGAPLALTANFSTPAGIFLSANTAGTRSFNGVVENVPLALTNNTTSGVGSVVITAIDGIQVITGTGTVTLSSALPIALGDLAPNATSSPFTLSFNWPSTVSRARFTVHFTANSGQYSGSTTLTINR